MRVGGVVLVGGHPRHNARVEVWSEHGKTRLAESATGVDGRFDVEVSSGSIVVVASAPRCAPASRRVEQATGSLRLELVGGVPARGVLVNEAAEPIAGATLEVFGAVPPIHRVTNERGQFDFPLLPRSAHTVVARADGYATRHIRVACAGAQRRHYTMRAGSSLKGTVRDSRGRPLPEVALRLYCNPHELMARSDEQGHYRIDGIPVGFPHRLTLEPPGRLPQPCALPIRYARASAVLEFDPVVGDGVTVSGAARAGAVVVMMRFTAERLLKRWGTASCDEAGAFSFSRVAPGTYLLHPYPRSSPNQASRTTNRTDQIVVEVHASDRTGLRIEVPPRGDLVVKVDPAHAGKRVRVAAGMSLHGTVDERGHARFDGLPAVPRAFAWFGGLRQEFGIEAGRTTMIVFTGVPGPRAVVTGVVVTADDEALAGAKVTLRDEHGTRLDYSKTAITVTGPDGRFHVELGPKMIAQSWVALATHPDHVTGYVRGLTIAAGGKPEIRIRMRSGLVLEGTVVDARGDPSKGTRVRITAQAQFDEWFVTSHRHRTTMAERLDRDLLLSPLETFTDGDGRFRFTHCTTAQCYAMAYGREGNSKKVPVKPGGDPVQLQLEDDRLQDIGGIILDESGGLVHAAYIKVIGTKIQAVTWHNGRFTLQGVPPGTHDVEVGARWGYDRLRFAKRIIEDVEAGTLDVIVRVEPGPTLRGRVLDADGNPIPRPEVVLLAARAPRSRSEMGTTKGEIDGTFEVRGIDSDAVEVGVFAHGYLPRLFPVPTGDAEFRLERGLSIRGRIFTPDGRAAPHRRISFQLKKPVDDSDVEPWKRKGQSYLPYFGAESDAEGRFSCSGLPAGEYRLRKPKNVPAITFRAGDSQLEFRMRGPSRIGGFVVDENGQPALSDGTKRLWVSASFEGRYVGSATLEDDGSFVLEGVPEGRIKLRTNGYPRFESKTVTVAAGSENVRIQLAAGRFRERK